VADKPTQDLTEEELRRIVDQWQWGEAPRRTDPKRPPPKGKQQKGGQKR
jgi:hypothetical protein